MKLQVKLLNGVTTTFDVESNDTLEDIKKMIAEKYDTYNWQAMRVVYVGKQLKDDTYTVEKLKFKEDSTIVVLHNKRKLKELSRKDKTKDDTKEKEKEKDNKDDKKDDDSKDDKKEDNTKDEADESASTGGYPMPPLTSTNPYGSSMPPQLSATALNQLTQILMGGQGGSNPFSNLQSLNPTAFSSIMNSMGTSFIPPPTHAARPMPPMPSPSPAPAPAPSPAPTTITSTGGVTSAPAATTLTGSPPAATSSVTTVPADKIKQLTDMGFTENQSIAALEMAGGDVQYALNLLLT